MGVPLGVSAKTKHDKFHAIQKLILFCIVPIIAPSKKINHLSLKLKGLYFSLSSLITLGKRLCVVSAQGEYNVLAGSYQAQARTALEIMPPLKAVRTAGLSKHIT